MDRSYSRLKRNDFKLNRHFAFAFRLSMIFSEKPVSTNQLSCQPIGPGGRDLRDSPKLHMRSGRCRRRGIESLGDLPRPDRLGLVMK
jgi:hypothetical protein